MNQLDKSTPSWRSKTEALVIHHTVMPTTSGPVEVNSVHRARFGSKGIGYNAIVWEGPGGWQFSEGRGLSAQGAHTRELGMNSRAFGLAVAGNWTDQEENGCPPSGVRPWETHPEMWGVLVRACSALVWLYGLTENDIYAHRDFKPTLCCGFPIEPLKKAVWGAGDSRYKESDRMFRRLPPNLNLGGQILAQDVR